MKYAWPGQARAVEGNFCSRIQVIDSPVKKQEERKQIVLTLLTRVVVQKKT